MKPKRKKRKDDFRESLEYQKLVAGLRKIINEAKAKGVEFGARDDILTCRGCGTYEDITHEGVWEVREKDERLTNHERFIIIDTKEKGYYRNKIQHFKMTYTFICPACGLQQEEIVRDQFEDI